MSPYPLVRTTNGGATWSDVGLPPAPHVQQGDGFGLEPDGITALPDGGLLGIETGGWELLAPGGRSWCRVRTPIPSPRRTYQLSAATVIGSQLWWLTGSLTSDAIATINEVPLTALSC